MRAVQVSEFGGPERLRLEDVPEPSLGEGEIVIRPTAVGLNFFDTLVLRNRYQITPSLPFSPGAEIAGEIEGLGPGVSGLRIGQRVVAFIGGNGCREKVITKARNAIPIPDGVSDEAAAGIPVTYGTALHAFKDRAQLKEGESVAVLGAAGGAGAAAIEIAKLMGGARHRRRLLGRQARLCTRSRRRRERQLRNRRPQGAAQRAHRRRKASTCCTIPWAATMPSRP